MNTLADICARKREHIARRKAEIPESRLLEKAKFASAARGFLRALENKVGEGQIGLIAEIKKASPSKGVIRADFQSVALARAYEESGAACLSVVTDEPFFQGHDEYLKAARQAVELPALRKDFMLDPYQVAESRALGADCILLIMAALEDAQAAELRAASEELGMDVLVEVHDRAELDRALKFNPAMIGINNRSLKTLEVNMATAEGLAKHLPKGILAVCESGIATRADIERMRRSGFSCFLVGEALMREKDVALATKKLLGTNHA